MKTETEELRNLRTLILRSRCESLSESEIAQLNQLIRSEGGGEEAAALIDQLCAFSDSSTLDSLPMTNALAKTAISEALGHRVETTLLAREPATDAARQVDLPPRQSTGWAKANWLLALVASHVLIASLVWSFSKPSEQEQSLASLDLRTSVPELVSMTACVWRPTGSTIPTLGQSIQLGEVLDLVEGIAELRIGEGTPGESLVRVEGPASIFIRGDGQLDLRQGSLTAKSLGAGSGVITIKTPMGEVWVDGQSSIGLVADGSKQELHVFSGRASVRPTVGISTAKEIRLEDTEAVRFSPNPGEDFGVVMFEASMSDFVSARSSGFDPLNVGKTYVDAVLESKPSVYWRFEELTGDSPYRVANQGSASNMDAVILGEAGWRRYGENRVAELGKLGTSSGFRSTGLWPPEPLDEYTVECWVKPELYHHGEMFCMHESRQKHDGRYSHTMMLETLAQHWRKPLQNLLPNRVRFVHRSPASGEVSEGSNMVGKYPYQVRTWQHVAAQKRGDRALLWIDGQLAARQSDASPMMKEMQIVLGQLYVKRTERRFVGQIDEVAIYDRCLTPAELRKHIRAAGRSVAPKAPELAIIK